MIPKNDTQNPILSDYNTIQKINNESDLTAITVQRGLISAFPIAISLAVTLYGFYLFLNTIIGSMIFTIVGTIILLGAMLLYMENSRTPLLGDLLGSWLEKLVIPKTKIPYFGGAVAIVITTLFVSLDTWGALQSADSIERMLIEGIVKSSEQYKIAKIEAESGVKEKAQYRKDLNSWRESKTKHSEQCNQKWRVPRYRTKNQQCQDSFNEPIPQKPKSTIDSSKEISEEKYNELEAKAKEKIAGYRKIFFWVFLITSILLNYFAVSPIVTQFRRKRKELTEDVIEELQNRFELMNAEKINKIKLSTDIQKQKLEEKNIIDVQLEQETYNIILAKKLKALENKRQVPLRIANSEYMPIEQSKAGFVSVSTQKKQFNKADIIYKLFLNGEAKEGDKLTGKGELINIKNRSENEKMVALYSELEKARLIENKRGRGYFALVDYTSLESV
ncbi:MAG TPA: hypothetical protein ENK66_04240 [Arcobacter sp.]|nr:hypothetical protein [Arcobacter sp.]